jgi:hypothetical protein
VNDTLNGFGLLRVLEPNAGLVKQILLHGQVVGQRVYLEQLFDIVEQFCVVHRCVSGGCFGRGVQRRLVALD